MAMTTRFASKKREENNDPLGKMKMIESKFTVKPGLVDEKRRAFGDINNKRDIPGAAENNLKNGIEKKQIQTTLSGVTVGGITVYKDVKPRVDTRWKKREEPRAVPVSSTAVAAASQVVPARPLSRQDSKASDLTKRTSNVKSITEKITMQIKKTTSIASTMDYKKIQVKSERREEPLIRSPAKMLAKRIIKQSGVEFLESHSTHMIHQVDNIDENDRENPQMLAEYANDIYAYLMKLEVQFPIRTNFLENQMDVTPKMRSVLLDWLNEVHHQFNLEVETFHMTVSIIDRYLQANPGTPRRYLQLVGVTALFMAAKYEELMPPDISDFVYVTDDTYSKKQILQMEMNIFKTLDFSLCKPLPIHFVRRFAKAAGKLGDRQYIAAKYFIELSTMDYELTKYKPSEIAAAAIYLSLYITNKLKSDDDLWTPTLQFYSTYKAQHFLPIVKRMALNVSTAQEVKLQSVFNKYGHAQFKFASTMPEMTGSKIRELARYA